MEESLGCISCGKDMSRIVYGYPAAGLSEIAKENNWILGGCMPMPIKFYCRDCKVSWSNDLGFDNEG